MEIVSNIALITINETLVAQMVSFLIFLFLINRIMIRPLRATMQERDGYIKEIKTSIIQSEEQLTSMELQLRENEQAAIKEADSQREALADAGSVQADQILADARQEIDGIRAHNQSVVDQQISEARKSLVKESEKLALQIMEKILDRGVARG